MRISLIFARTIEGVIGKGLELPWPRLKPDMLWFKSNTVGKPVLMGRKTYDSLNGRKLPDRKMIIVSRSLKEEDIINKDDDIYVCSSIEQGIELAKSFGEELMVIGGAEIYKYFIDNDLVDKYYITAINPNFKGDVYIPKYSLTNYKRTTHIVDQIMVDEERVTLDFFTYERKQNEE